jgi:CheY-like chemotaxis protein
VELSEEYAWQRASVKSGSYVMLAISDTGCGMSAEILSHIFEPFFTTKEKGKGTGLGLSTVYGIVQQSGGHIWVYSEVGRGTTFKIYLPVISGEAEVALPRPKLADSPRGWETVLVVEDEDLVRNLTCLTLRLKGYNVLEATNGGEAFLLCEKKEEPIHLLLTDVVMPQLGGRDLARRLKQVRPEMKVLFMSGYTEDAIVHHGVLEPGLEYIQKPFSPDALVRLVRGLLDSPDRGKNV